MTGATCRFCASALSHVVTDLGMSPLCESFVPAEKTNAMEPFYPLKVWVCERCFLVQLEQYVTADEIFSDYAYFSSFSDSWLKHARDYSVAMIDRWGLGPQSFVVELASNDGYLLRNFVERKIPCLGIEPAANCAEAARRIGVPTDVRFFGVATARDMAARGQMADLLLGNNVFAQVPDVNDFVGGMPLVLKPGGVVTLEFPHLLRLMDENQFDTIYHEHFSYFSLLTTEKILAAHGLVVFDVEELKSHGGSLRVYARHAGDATKPVVPRVGALLAREKTAGLDTLAAYATFDEKVRETKRRILELLIDLKRRGKRIVGYGAPGKGNTLLNYCGIRTDFLEFTVDRNPHKQGRFLPGTHIPILHPDKLWDARPDYVFILPWNLQAEIVAQLAGIREWGGQFIVPIPEARIVS